MGRLLNGWILLLRLSVGGFWTYFSSQRLFDLKGLEGILNVAASNNYVPFFRDLLRSVVMRYMTEFVISITIAELIVGILIVIGFATRIAGAVGSFIALYQLLTFSFCSCPWNETDASTVFWFYFSAVLLNIALVRERHDPRLSIMSVVMRHRRT